MAKLHELGIVTVQDVLFHLPLRYEDRTRVVPIADLIVGQRSLVEGDIVQAVISGGRRRFLHCQLKDASGIIALRFFHFNQSQYQTLRQDNVTLCCFGEVRSHARGIEMIHPEYRLIERAQELTAKDQMTAVYPTTQGLRQQVLRKIVAQALALLDQADYRLPEGLPEKMLASYQLPSLHEALCYLHHPPSELSVEQEQKTLHCMRQRLIFEELMAHQLSILRLRSKVRSQLAHGVSSFTLQDAFCNALPFTLTSAQQRVVLEVNKDLQQCSPMLRLIQGDVGCGKTVVAALAALAVIEEGYQVALMAPTELLAEQHYKNFVRWFEPLQIAVGWLPGKLPARVKEATLSEIASGDLKIVIGTHALLQQHVTFQNLALIIVDEQHRFGVYQRLSLKEKGESADHFPHQLIMTATPIPRSLAMSAYGDLDCSTIDELPPGREPVITALVSQDRRDAVIARVRANCQTGRQAYWVCTLVEESEVLQCQAAESTAKALRQCMPELQVGLIHGRLTSAEKESLMEQFGLGKIDVLVATTVVEVGVDVPNASLMIIENPERLGLAQLHQLRGRVGRGKVASYCVLLYQEPLSENAQARLQVIREHNDGFHIAQQDLLQRGPGEILGSRQAGIARFRIADMIRDQLLMSQIRSLAFDLLEELPTATVTMLIARWLGGVEDTLQV